MTNIRLDCPHCKTEKVGFYGTCFMHCRENTHEYIALMQCGYCREGVIVKYDSYDFASWFRDGDVSNAPEIVNIWPKIEGHAVPNNLPKNIRSFFLQGVDSLYRKNYDAAGTMFRKTLDIALKRIHPEGKGQLYSRINNLPVDLGITPAMREWAHEIRVLGNDAAHEEEPFTEADARALHAFSETFLTYAFTLPGLLEERRKKGPPA